jgi:hypothetical protein
MSNGTLKAAVILLMMTSFSFALAMTNQPAAPTAPLPPAISAAKTVFLSNSCNDSYTACTNLYNELYAGLQSEGKYTLVLAPAQADLVFEIHYSTRLSGVGGSAESGPVSTYGSNLQLLILDRATRVVLWSISESGNRKTSAQEQVLGDLKTLAAAGNVTGTGTGPSIQQTTKTRFSDNEKK